MGEEEGWKIFLPGEISIPIEKISILVDKDDFIESMKVAIQQYEILIKAIQKSDIPSMDQEKKVAQCNTFIQNARSMIGEAMTSPWERN